MKHRTVIIGGGAIGSSIAMFLGQSKHPDDEIVVIERDPGYTKASSSLSASSIRQQFATPTNIRLSQFGFEYMQSCTKPDQPGNAVGFQAASYLFLGRADQAPALRSIANQVRALNAEVNEYDAATLQARWPWLDCADLDCASQARGGEGWFDGYLLLQWYRARALAAGVRYLKAEVTGLKVHGSRITSIQLSDGEDLQADQVVNAAGAWSANIVRMLGSDIPVRARRRTMFLVSCPNPLVAPERFPILIDTSGVFIRPEQNHFLCTLSPAPQDDLDELPLDPDISLFETRIWPALAARVPAFEALRIERAWAGYYEFNTRDHNGLVGRFALDNFFLATGFSGHGLMHSAGIGRGMAELLNHGHYQSIDLSPLSAERLQSGKLIVETAVY